MISTSISTNSITVVITSNDTNNVYTLASTNPNYDAVLDAVRLGDEDSIHALCNIAKSIETFTEGNVKVENGHVYYNNTLMDGVIVDRILGFVKEKLPVQPLLRFINKLNDNSSARAVSELYKFLEHKNMPITPEGNFLAYKGVTKDYYSITAGTIEVIKGTVKEGKIFNGVGEKIEVKRNQVCDNKDIGCSAGIHAGSLQYATEFSGSVGKVVIVEIDPKDVVSIPTDCMCQKLRACAYKVVSEFEVPLNDNYCDKYSSKDSEESDDDEYENYHNEAIDSATEYGYEIGFEHGMDKHCFDNTVDRADVDQLELSDVEYEDAWRYGYQKGYVEGIESRASLK